MFEFKFPDVGEGINEGEIVKWRVKVGDEVKIDQVLVEMETAKAIVELPSPESGFILALNGKEGDTVKVGSVIVVIGKKGEKIKETLKTETQNTAKKSSPGVVGEIPTESSVVLPPRKEEKVSTSPAKSTEQKSANKDEYGALERTPLHGMRKTIAQYMTLSASTIPQVTHMDEFDATALIVVRGAKKAEAEKKGIKLTYLPFIIKAVSAALIKFPAFNASLEKIGYTGEQEIILKKYHNFNIAVDTEDGLMAPVIKNVDKKDLLQIAEEIALHADACRNRKIHIDDLQGGSFTITNIGSIGGIYATPLVTYGQTACLGVMRMKEKPAIENGKVMAKQMLTFALSYDHRVVDGAQAARFMNEIIEGCMK